MERQSDTKERTIELTDANAPLSQAVDDVAHGDGSIVVAQDGQPVAAIISIAEYRRFRAQEDERATDFDALARFSEAFRDVPDDELEREIAKALAEARAELRAEREASLG